MSVALSTAGCSGSSVTLKYGILAPAGEPAMSSRDTATDARTKVRANLITSRVHGPPGIGSGATREIGVDSRPDGATFSGSMTEKHHFATSQVRAGLGALQALIFEYLEDLEINGRSELTSKRYGGALRTFADWLAFQVRRPLSELGVDDITEERLRLYRLFLARRRDQRSGRPLSAATRNGHQIALRGFLTYCARRRKLDVPDPTENLELAKERDTEIRHLARDEFERMLSAVDLSRPNGLRDRVLLETLFGTGVRVSELAGLTIRQVDLERREIEVVGKGGRSRLVVLTEEAAGWVRRYLEQRKDDHPALFVGSSRKGLGALGVRQIERIVGAAAQRAGLPFAVSPHWLRHSRLTIVARHSGVHAAQRIAGHASLQTTARYLHVTDAQLKSLYDQAEKADKSS